jgi:hypothetical protein
VVCGLCDVGIFRNACWRDMLMVATGCTRRYFEHDRRVSAGLAARLEVLYCMFTTCVTIGVHLHTSRVSHPRQRTSFVSFFAALRLVR